MTVTQAPNGRQPVRGRVSFVVPTRNSGRTIEACLTSIVSQQHDDVELVVIDNHSTDSTAVIAQNLADRFEIRGPERCAQRNRGAEVATGELVAFIDSDMVLEPGVASEAIAAFRIDSSLGGLVIPERAFGSGMWIGARRLEKESYLGDPAVEAARVFPVTVFDEVGGYDETMVAAEDWDLPDRISATGGSVGRIASHVWHDEGHISLRECFKKKRYYGHACLSYSQRDPDQRRNLVRGRWQSLVGQVAHAPVRGTGLILLKSVEAAGFGLGLMAARRQTGP